MRFAKLGAAVAGFALSSTLALAADNTVDKKDKAVKPATTANKPTDKGAQGGIILQNQGGKPADKGAQGGIILQNQGGKPADKGAQGGIILQNQGAAKAPAATGKTATPKATGGTQ
jgi:ribosomal protein S20